MIFLFSSLDFSEISEGRRVKSFRKFLKGEGLNRLRKFTGQGNCSHIHSEVFLGNMHCFWDSVLAKIGAAKNVLHLQAHVSCLLSHMSEHVLNQFGLMVAGCYPKGICSGPLFPDQV